MTQLAKIEAQPVGALGPMSTELVPIVVAKAGDEATYRYIEFLTAHIPNINTHRAYARALREFFAWVELHRLALRTITPMAIAA